MLGLIGAFYLKQIIMKKLVLVSSLAIGLFSCQKQDSWCGLVVSKNDKLNSIVVKDSRTGELKTIYLLKAEYAVAPVSNGSEWCTLSDK